MQTKPQILIVDDEEGPRESLKIILKPEFDVVALARGSEALELLSGGDYEAVLLDLTMPEDLSGTDTLAAIRAAGIDVEAIVISGQGAADPIVACVNLGASRYVKKPYRADDVLAAVRTAVAERRRRRRACAMRERLLGHLSHELRTPLNAIVGYSEILDDEAGGLLAEEHRLALARIRHSSEHLLASWENLSFLGELDSGSLAASPREFALRPWLERVTHHVARAAGGLRVALSCPNGMVACAHPETLERLIAVLIYEASQVGRRSVAVSAWEEKDSLHFSIEYDGVAAADGGGPEPGMATELARELVSRATVLLGASLERRVVAERRTHIEVHLPEARSPRTPAHAAAEPSPGSLAAAPR